MKKGSKNGIVPTAMTMPVKKSRGGLRNHYKAKTVQHLQDDFMSDAFEPTITFAYGYLKFSTSCVNLFPDTQFVTISLDKSNRRFFVQPTLYCDEYTWMFARSIKGKNVPRTCPNEDFCQRVFDLMKWNPKAKYRIETIYQEFDDKRIMVFNFDDARQM